MNTNEVEISIPQTRETMLKASRNGMLEILSANEALAGFAHTPIFPWHLAVAMTAKELVEEGMPTPAEGDLLLAIGEEIDAALMGARTATGAVNALFLVRSTWNGFRELEYYVHDAEVAHAALQALIASRQWEREWSYTLEEDPDWDKATPVFQLMPQANG
ncbi:MAG: DUF695 domain-containing protein [Telluria sp.]